MAGALKRLYTVYLSSVVVSESEEDRKVFGM
jgi:hypothetical protein